MSVDFLTQPLVSNGYTLSTAPQRLGWLTPTDPALPMEQLREQYKAQGYLWLKGVLDRDEVLAFRRRFFAALQDTGLLVAGSDPVEGRYSGNEDVIERDRVNKVYLESMRWPEYEQFCKTPRLWQFYQSFWEAEPYLHKRKLIRYNTPIENNCTGGHYDLIYLRAGTDRICSSWIPIGDVPVAMGGLVYLEGSDTLGRKMEAEFTAKNATLSPEERISAYNKNMKDGGWISTDLPALADLFNGRWLIANYEAGDMVVHSPYMLHASTLNRDPQRRIRLSTDIRYQRASDAIDPRWTEDWSPSDKL